MQIEKIIAEDFGCLKNWESPTLKKNLIVVLGNNESGKTTLFNLVSTILYGFNPVVNNPYRPWDEKYAGCGADIIYMNGERAKVARRLRSKAEGSIIINDKRTDMGNKALDQLEFMPVSIFKEVYALSVDQLRFPDQESWKEIQEQIFGGQYRSIFKDVRSVVCELDNEANSLWRKDRKGKPEDKKLLEQLSALKQSLYTARENEKAMYDIEVEIKNIDAEIDKAAIDRTNIIKSIDHIEKLYPIYKRFKKIDELSDRAGDIDGFINIPDNALELLDELENKKESLMKQYKILTAEREKAQVKFNSLSPFDRIVYGQKENIAKLTRSYGQIENDISVSLDLSGELGRQRENLKLRAREFILGGWMDDTSNKLEKIDEAELRACIQSYKASDLKYQGQNAVLTGLKIKKGGKKVSKMYLTIPCLLSILGIIGIILMGNSLPGLISAAVVVFSFSLLISFLIFNDKGLDISEYKEAEKHFNKIEEEKQNKIELVKSALKGLPVAPERLGSPDESLLVDVNIIKDYYYKQTENIEKKKTMEKRIWEKTRIVHSILDSCEIPGTTDILKDIIMLEKFLSDAESHLIEMRDARFKLDELNIKLSDIVERHNFNEVRQNAITAGLSRLEGNNLQEKMENLIYKRNCYKSALALKEEMFHDYSGEEEMLDEAKSFGKIDGEYINYEDKIVDLKVEREQIERRSNELKESLGSQKNDLQHRQGFDRIDDLEGQMACINDEREAISIKRDRLILLRNILNEADRAFREEYQPDILKRGGEYLEIITNARYSKLSVSDGIRSELSIKGNYIEEYLDMKEKLLSRGTREQIYLALRLALVDHLDGDLERLPLFLDEILVNWDNIRTENGLRLMEKLSKKRQIFMFTCHRWLADILLSGNDAQLIELQ